jgi:hypothetical protein
LTIYRNNLAAASRPLLTSLVPSSSLSSSCWIMLRIVLSSTKATKLLTYALADERNICFEIPRM